MQGHSDKPIHDDIGIPDIVLEIGEVYYGTNAVVKFRLDDAGPRAGKPDIQFSEPDTAMSGSSP
jgi:hypothetical protein